MKIISDPDSLTSQVLGLDAGCLGRHEIVRVRAMFSTFSRTTTICSFVSSPVFDPIHGLGGNGQNIPNYQGQFGNLSNFPGWSSETTTGGGCLVNGPFASYNLSLGPGPILNNPRCIQRAFSSAFFDKMSNAAVENATSQPTFERFRIELEGWPVTPTARPHDGVHVAVGGDMSDSYSSPSGE